MYDLLKNAINAGSYNLADMLTKINTLWIQNELTEEQRNELVDLARKKASASDMYAPLEDRVAALERRQNEILERLVVLEGGGEEPEPGPEPEPTLPDEWKQPTGAHDAYNIGMRCKYKDRYYESIMNGNAWAPDVYPAGWKDVTDEYTTGKTGETGETGETGDTGATYSDILTAPLNY